MRRGSVGGGEPVERTPASVRAALSVIRERKHKTEAELKAATQALAKIEEQAAAVAAQVAVVSTACPQGAGATTQAAMIKLETQRRHVEADYVAADQRQRNLAVSVEVYEQDERKAKELLAKLEASQKGAGGRRRFSWVSDAGAAAAAAAAAAVPEEEGEAEAKQPQAKPKGRRRRRRFSLE